jgi:hypothetical protein
MARACGFDFSKDEDSDEAKALEEAATGDAGSGARAFSAERREPNSSSAEPATSNTTVAPKAPTQTNLLPELLPDQGPFPITLFLRFTPIIWRD